MAISASYLLEAKECLVDEWGPVDLEGPEFRVDDFTSYYQDNMGKGLIKQYFSFETLRSVEEMNRHAKFWSNDLEQQFLSDAGQRKINLDPGYLTLDKLLLYTTKNFTHRIYIRDGLFAEITLSYSRKAETYQPFNHTYPDYATEEALEFFLKMRNRMEIQQQQ